MAASRPANLLDCKEYRCPGMSGQEARSRPFPRPSARLSLGARRYPLTKQKKRWLSKRQSPVRAFSTSRPTCRATSARRRRRSRSSSRPTRRRSGPRPKAVEAYLRPRPTCRATRTARRDRAARGDRQALRARSRAHRLRRRLRRAAQSACPRLSRAGRRGDLHRARLPGLPDRHRSRRGATPVVAPETRPHSRRRRDPRARDADERAWCSSPTRTTRPAPISRSTRCGACTPACPADVLLVLDAAYAEYVRRERLRGRHRAGRHHPEHGDDAHLLQDLRPRRAAHRLGLLPGRRSPTR